MGRRKRWLECKGQPRPNHLADALGTASVHLTEEQQGRLAAELLLLSWREPAFWGFLWAFDPVQLQELREWIERGQAEPRDRTHCNGTLFGE